MRWRPEWVDGYQRRDLAADVAAGLTVGAMLVPQAMAYAQLAGLPPEVGLYSVTLPLLAYAAFGSSRQLSVGPVAVVSLLTASALAPVAAAGTAEYVAAAAVLAVMVGLATLVLGVVRMGWITNLLSHPVLVGFTGAAAIIIGVSQFEHVLGLSVPRTEHVAPTLVELARAIGDVHLATVAIAAASLSALVVLRRWRGTFPAALVVVIAGIAASGWLDLGERGVAVVGDVPGGLPAIAFPTVGDGMVGRLVPIALTITLVGYMESIAVAKVYARRNRDEIRPNREFVALGLANVTAGVVGGQPVTGGFSRTAVNAAAGARTPLASVVSAAVVTLVLLFLTGALSELPQAVLGSIVIVAVLGLVDVAEIRHIATVKRSDAAVLATTFAATLAFGVELGIAVGVSASLMVIVARIMTPRCPELGRVTGSDDFADVEGAPGVERVAGTVIVRIDASLGFANVTFVRRRLALLTRSRGDDLRHLVIDAAGVNDLDAAGASALADLVGEYDARGITIHLADVRPTARDVLVRSGLWTRLGDRTHPTVAAAVATLDHPRPSGPTTSALHERISPT